MCLTFLESETTYTVKAVTDVQGKKSGWSEEAEFTTPKFTKYCAWKECPEDVDERRKCSLSRASTRAVAKKMVLVTA